MLGQRRAASVLRQGLVLGVPARIHGSHPWQGAN
jgi:hypothetical protein